MFFCDNWPNSLFKSCRKPHSYHKTGNCNDVPSKYLPMPVVQPEYKAKHAKKS
jgi:hypothetical protein